MANRLHRYALVLFTCSLVFAGTVSWSSKDFRDWTVKDARQLLTDSPWAKSMPTPGAGRPTMVVESTGVGTTAPTAALGNPSNTNSGSNIRVPANEGGEPASNMPGGQHTPTAPAQSGMWPAPSAPPLPPAITIIWASAPPVRLAVSKLRAGDNPPSHDQVQRALSPTKGYVIAVLGLPPPVEGSDIEQLAKQASLTFKGKEPVESSSVDYRQVGERDIYFFRFPKIPITGDEGRAEFRLNFEGLNLHQKFELGAMRYQGKLAL